MRAIDIVLTALLALWALGSVLFLFRLPGLHGVLRRWNRSRWLVHWSLFSPSDPALRPGTFELRYRDLRAHEADSSWQVGATGHAHAWHAGVWLPRRMLASAVQNIGREILALSRHEPPANAAVDKWAGVLRTHLARARPRPPGARREYELVRRFASDGTGESVLRFSDPENAAVA